MSTVDGSVALVTGSTSGIGRAIADRLALAGACVVLNSRTPLSEPVRLGESPEPALHLARRRGG